MGYITPIFFIDKDVDIFDIESIDNTIVNKALAKELSVSQTEFYKAQALDIKLEFKLEVRSFEFDNQEYLFKDNEVYKIHRAYKNGSKYELTCTKENLRIDFNG